MGKCAKRTKAIIKDIARQLTPIGVAMIGKVVGELSTQNLSSGAKRAEAFERVKTEFLKLGIQAKEHAIRAAIEAAVGALHQGADAIADLGQMQPGEVDAETA